MIFILHFSFYKFSNLIEIKFYFMHRDANFCSKKAKKMIKKIQ